MADDDSSLQDNIEAYLSKLRLDTVKRGPARSSAPEPQDFFLACLASPRMRELAGLFHVSQDTVRKWIKNDPKLEASRNRALAADALELMTVARRKGLEGSVTHLKIAIAARFPDMLAADTQVNVNNVTQIKILPTPSTDGDVIPFKDAPIIEGRATQLTPPEEKTSGLPLFGGKIMRPS